MRKIVLICILLVSTMLVLIACTGGNEEVEVSNNSANTGEETSNSTTPAQEPESEAAPEIEPAEIVFYSANNDPVESFDYRFGNSLREKFPHHTIEYIQSGDGKRLPELVTAGIPFDIYFHTIGNYEKNAFTYGIDYDMTDLIKQFNVDLDRFEPTVIDHVQNVYDGGMFALPVFTTNFVLYYNKDIFDMFGEEYPADDMTWDEMVELAKRLTRNEEGEQYLGYAHSSLHTLRLNPMSIPRADLETDTPTINTDDRWKTFFDTYYRKPTDVDGYREYLAANGMPHYNEFVRDRNVAMLMYLSSLITVWEEEMQEVNFDWAALPTVEEGVGSQSYPAYFGITQMARNKEAAMEVLKYMTSDEFQAELARKAINPVVQSEEVISQYGADSPFSDKNLAAAYYNDFAPIPEMAPYDSDLVSLIHGNMQLVLRGMTDDINTALRTTEEQALQKIEEYKANNE